MKKKRKINYIGLVLVFIVLLLLISNICVLIDRSRNYLKKDHLLQLAQEYDYVSINLLNEIFPDKTFYFYKNELQVSPILKINKNNYDFGKYLDATNSIYKYKDEKVETYIGVDVSNHNDEIDWEEVKNSGVDFAMIRVGYRGYTEGELHLDANFEENIQGAITAGLDVGVYFFSQAINEIELLEEVDLVLGAIKDYRITYPVVYDMEEISNSENRTQNLEKDTVTKLTRLFCDKIKENGYTPMIYGNRNWLMGMLDLEQFEDIDKWLALYNREIGYIYDYKIWQYTENGKISGIDGKVDLNISFKKYQ